MSHFFLFSKSKQSICRYVEPERSRGVSILSLVTEKLTINDMDATFEMEMKLSTSLGKKSVKIDDISQKAP